MKETEFIKGDVVILHDTRGFYDIEDSEQDYHIKGFPIPLGIVVKSYLFANVEIYSDAFPNHRIFNFHLDSLEKIDHIDPKDWENK